MSSSCAAPLPASSVRHRNWFANRVGRPALPLPRVRAGYHARPGGWHDARIALTAKDATGKVTHRLLELGQANRPVGLIWNC